MWVRVCACVCVCVTIRRVDLLVNDVLYVVVHALVRPSLVRLNVKRHLWEDKNVTKSYVEQPLAPRGALWLRSSDEYG